MSRESETKLSALAQGEKGILRVRQCKRDIKIQRNVTVSDMGTMYIINGCGKFSSWDNFRKAEEPDYNIC